MADRIGCIIDVDGFPVPDNVHTNKFLCKELGVTYLYKPVSERYTFKVGKFYELPAKVRITASWVMRNIHGMRFEDTSSDLPQSSLMSILSAIQATCIVESNKPYIAYKGGHYERNLLRAMCIPHYNLENMGCPRYDELLTMYNVISSPTCGLHCYALPGKSVHCPQSETMLFRKWMLNE